MFLFGLKVWKKLISIKYYLQFLNKHYFIANDPNNCYLWNLILLKNLVTIIMYN